MTVIIAGICGDKVVMLGDRMNMMEEETHEQRFPKIYCVNKSICMGFAGTSGFEKEFVENLDNIPSLEELFESFKERYRKLRMRLIKENILGRYGVESVDELKSLVDDPDVMSLHLEEIKNFDPDIKILVGGVDSSPHIFAVGNPGTGAFFDDIGFYAIGTGEKEASMMLNFLNFRKDLPLRTCILYLYIAKKAAEIAVGVGKKTDIFVISKEGVEMVDEKDYYLMFQSWIGGLEEIGGGKE